MDEILTAAEIAAILKVNRETVFRLINRGEIPARKVSRSWRVRRQDFDAWFNKGIARNRLKDFSKVRREGTNQ